MLARAASLFIDSFLSVLRSEAPYKVLHEFESTCIPDWGSRYQFTDETRKKVEAIQKKVLMMIGPPVERDDQIAPKIDDLIVKGLMQKFDRMTLDIQEGKITWEELLPGLRELAGPPGEDADKKFVEIFINARALVISIASRLGYRKPIYILYDEAKNGDDDALFKMVTLDKGIITTDWASLRIRKATLGGELRFFNKLGAALNKKPFTKKKQLRLAAFVLFFWEFGFKELTYLERVEFLEIVGFRVSEIPEQDTLRKLIYRLQGDNL